VLDAVSQFRQTANAAAQAWQQRPPYIAYRVSVAVDVPAMKKYRVINRSVETRTSDDRAAIQDLPKGERQYGQSFPLIPTFDALSYFRLDFHMADPIRMHNPIAAVNMQQPITFGPAAASNADIVVVSSLRNYYAHYAPDSTDARLHLEMDPLPALTHDNDSTFYIHDVYIDPATSIPVRVTYVGPTTEFDIDYTTVDNHVVVSHVFYKQTLMGILHLGRTTYTVDARYDNFSFPQTPADPKIAAAP
jgi:hypothetical protein